MLKGKVPYIYAFIVCRNFSVAEYMLLYSHMTIGKKILLINSRILLLINEQLTKIEVFIAKILL